jgi:cell division septation protein DedD
MAENRKDNDGLYYFSKTQGVIVGLGFTATCVLVFLLGILIGQGIEERKLLKQEEPLVKVPLQPLATGAKAGSSGKDELTFYDTLAKTPAGAQARGEAAKEAKVAEKTAKPDTKPAKDTKPEQKEPQDAQPVAESNPAKAVGADVAQKARAAENATVPENKKAAKTAGDEKTQADTTGQERAWTVQVNAYPEEARAQKLIERLKQKGYDAYLVKASINGKDWYRVRVGHFASRSLTKELLQELQTKENFPKAIAVSR